MRRSWLIFLIALTTAGAQSRLQINPQTQIQWPNITGSGAPTLTCAPANYGQPYLDTVANVSYTCGSSGWVSPSAVAAWGSITGTLTSQADLVAQLAGKVPTTTTVNTHPLSGNITLTGNDLASGTPTFNGALFTPYTVSTLPSIGPTVDGIVWVTDGTTTSDCSVGGGGIDVPCIWNGLSWQAVVLAVPLQTTTTANIVATMVPSSNANASNGAVVTRKALGNCYTGWDPGTSTLLPTSNGGDVYCTSAIQTSATSASPAGPTLGFVNLTCTGTGCSAFNNGNGAGGTHSPTAVTLTYGGTSTDNACPNMSSVVTGIPGLTLPGNFANSSQLFTFTNGTGASTDVLSPSFYVVPNGDTADHYVRSTCWRINNSNVLNFEYDTNYHPSSSDYYGLGWQYSTSVHMFQYCPQACPAWRTLKGIDPTGANPPLTSYTVPVGHWIFTAIFMDRGSVASCTSSSATGCFFYRKLWLQDITAGTPGVMWNLYDALTGLVPSGIPVSLPTWTKNQFGIQLQIDTNTASVTPSVDVNSDSVAAYQEIAGTTGPTQPVETRGALGEWDFDGNDTSVPVPTGSPILTSAAYTTPGAMEYNAISTYDTVPTLSSCTTCYGRFYMQVNTNAAASVQVFGLYNGTTQLGNLYLNSSNQYLTFFNTATSTSTQCANSVSFGTNTFHLIEFQWIQGASGSFLVKVDGVQTCAVSPVNTGSSAVDHVRFGQLNAPSTAWDLTIDNVGVDNLQFLGPVKFVPTTVPVYQPFFGQQAGITLASAGTITPVGQVQHITGTVTISTITPPSTSNCTNPGYACQVTLIPDGLWATSTSGNIAVATTAVVGKALIETYDPVTLKWYPSY